MKRRTANFRAPWTGLSALAIHAAAGWGAHAPSRVVFGALAEDIRVRS